MKQITKQKMVMTDEYVENIDSWVKEINNKFSDYNEMPKLVEENAGNVQHNYELITDLKKQIDKLKEEITTLKFVQLVQLKPQIQKAYKS